MTELTKPEMIATQAYNEARGAGASEEQAAREADAIIGVEEEHCEDCTHCFGYYARDVVGRKFYECTLADPPVAVDVEDSCEYLERRESDAIPEQA